jgi:YD repeat-containing protein
VGALALLGTLLLFIGVSLSSAASSESWEEKVLPNIYKQLKQANKVLKSHQVIEAGEKSKVIVTCANGEVRQYNQQGQLLEVKDAQGKVTTYVNGMPSEEKDSNGALIAKTEYQHDGGKVASSVRRSAGEIEMKVFDNAGNIAQVINSQGTKAYSNYQKNTEGHTTGYNEIDMTSGKMSRVELNASGDVVAKVDENGNRTALEYARDAAGDVVAVTERDSQGNVTIKKMKNGQILETIKNGVSTKVDNKLSGSGKVQESTETTTIKTDKGTLLQKVYKQFDLSGRLQMMRDQEGEHRYSYVLGAGGRMLSRHEQLTPAKGSSEKPKETTTYYDLAGRVIGTEENGKRMDMSYTLDAAGNILGSSETTTDRTNGRAASERVDKKYDGKGHILQQTDNLGRTSSFEYDAKGNRTKAATADVVTQYFYDGNGNMRSSIATDFQSTTYASMNTETKLTESKVKVYNNGFSEVTKYTDNESGQRTSCTKEPLDIKATVYHDRQGEQPLHSVTTKFNGKQTITDYTYTQDSLVSSKESGPTGITQTNYTSFGKPDTAARVDQFGREYNTTYKYDGKQKTLSTLETDKKGKTLTLMDGNEQPSQVIRDNVIGFPLHAVETKSYTRGILTSSENVDIKGKTVTQFDPVTGLAMETHTTKNRTFPRETFVFNTYDDGGDIVSSFQKDSHGVTQNTFDKDGLMTNSTRNDKHGFPRVKKNNYYYAKGEMTQSTTATDRDFSTSNYDQNGLVHDTAKVAAFGYPRNTFTTFKYDRIGSMVSSDEGDINGTSHSDYNGDELASVTKRHDNWGHAQDKTTVFAYDNDGYMTFSKETDLKGLTTTQYNIDSEGVTSMRYDQYGTTFSRDSLTYNFYDNNGFMTQSSTRNLFGDSQRQVNKDGLTVKNTSTDNFGLTGGRFKVTSNYTYDDKGRMQTSVEQDALGVTNSNYDINGDAVNTLRYGNFGVGMARVTVTKSTFNQDTGMPTGRVASNAYGTTTSLDFDPILGTESTSVAVNNIGLLGSRITTSKLNLDSRHGLNRDTTASNKLGITKTTYDVEQSDGRFGVAVKSEQTNFFGLGGNRQQRTVIAANHFNGLNEKTEADSSYGHVSTTFDTVKAASWSNGTYGLAVQVVSTNNYGLVYTRVTTTNTILADPNTGLNEITQGVNIYGTTTNYYDTYETAPWGSYGIVVRAVAQNNFGLLDARDTTTTTLDADVTTGLNRMSQAVNKYGKTTSYYDTVELDGTTWSNGTYGMVVRTVAQNNFGLIDSRNTTTITKDADPNTGLNIQTVATNLYGTTTTNFDAGTGGTYGIAVGSIADNNFGLVDTRHTTTVITADPNNGLNLKTVASNIYGTTTTNFDAANGGTYGIAVGSVSDNNFGLLDTRHTVTVITADPSTGLNVKTVASNLYGVTVTDFDSASGGTYGIAVHSVADNNFGLIDTRHTVTAITADPVTGMNLKTVATNLYGVTVTDFDTASGGTYGVAVHSVADNNFGLIDSRHTDTVITADPNTGLNTLTVATNLYGQTTTKYDSTTGGTYGIAVSSHAVNNFGLLDTRTTDTAITADPATGLNTLTVATNLYGVTTTKYDSSNGGTYGIAVSSHAQNNFGLLDTRTTDTVITADPNNGLNTLTVATNLYGVTTTKYDSTTGGTYGIAVSSHAVNNFGLLDTRTTDTVITADPTTGMNTLTVATNLYGVTTTKYDSSTGGTYGVAVSSHAVNNFGLLDTRTTDTVITADLSTGLNTLTVATNTYGVTTTKYDSTNGGTYGIAVSSHAVNNFGLLDTRTTDTVITADPATGLNLLTVATNTYGVTTTKYDSTTGGTYGIAVSSHAENNFGLLDTRNTDTVITADPATGLNELTVATNLYGVTTTKYDSSNGGTYGVAVSSHAVNNFGLLDTRTTDTVITADPATGMNTLTVATNLYGVTTTKYDSTTGGTYGIAVWSHAVNNFGLLDTRTTDTVITADPATGLNTMTVATNIYGVTTTKYDSTTGGTYGTAVSSHAVNNFGLLDTRTTDTVITADPATGLNVLTVATNTYGVTTTKYDSTTGGTYGIAVSSHSVNNFGLLDTRTTDTAITADPATGLNTLTVATNTYGVTTTKYDSSNGGTYGIAVSSHAENNFGLLDTRTTDTVITADPATGLNTLTVATNLYGVTTTKYDSTNGGTYGVAVSSHAVNNFGLLDTRTTDTVITADPATGLNTLTVATNLYGVTTTKYDSTTGGTYGVAVSSHAVNNFGLLDTRTTDTQITSDPATGLNVQTVASNTYGTTTTKYDSTTGGTYGIAVSSHAVNNFGLLDTRTTDTVITSDPATGLNELTVATNAYGVTTTKYDSSNGGTYGIAVSSHAVNNFGLLDTRTTDTVITSDPNNGLNTLTVATNLYGVTTTKYDSSNGGTYGVAVSSHAVNNFGLLDTRTTDTVITSDPATGLNLETVATNLYGVTTTKYDPTNGGTYGTAVSSHAVNNFGLLDTRTTDTVITSDPATGLNTLTVATNAYGVTTTKYDSSNGGTYGTAASSHAVNNFGLLDTRTTDTVITSDPATGLNVLTVATNTYGVTTTKYDSTTGGTYGIAVSSHSDNNFGLLDTRSTDTVITSDPATGLNELTVATNAYGITTTKYDSTTGGTYGIAVSSHSVNNFGLLDTRTTDTVITSDPATGLNTMTVATNLYGVTTTKYDSTNGGTYGIAVSSHSVNNFGLLDTRTTDTVITSDPATGLNVLTVATNAYGVTTTKYDSTTGGTYGTAVSSHAVNNFGLLDTRTTDTAITSDPATGLNTLTVATNTYGVTTTKYDSTTGGTYGTAVSSHSVNNFGLLDTRTTDTVITSDPATGLNTLTVATNTYGVTTTKYDSTTGGTYGIAVSSHSDNNFGLLDTRSTDTVITSDPATGLNTLTVATNTYGVTTTKYDSSNGGTYGIAVSSHSVNNFGLLDTRTTDTVITSDPATGLNQLTVATNTYGTTTTKYDSTNGGTYGVAAWSHSDNNFGLLDTRSTDTVITSDPATGLNTLTVATNAYGVTTTRYDSTNGGTYGIATSSHSVNNFGLLDTRTTDTVITSNPENGLNELTVATNIYGVTTTKYDSTTGGTYGIAVSSHSDNNFGLLDTRSTDTAITSDPATGLNTLTVATNIYGVTTTKYDSTTGGTYGIAVSSHSDNHFGLLDTRSTDTVITSDPATGLNTLTVATNTYGVTTTKYDSTNGGTFGVAVWSHSDNHFGLLDTRSTDTAITSDPATGLNLKTVATNTYGVTTTDYDTASGGVYGLAVHSTSDNNFGLIDARHTSTAITSDPATGLNVKTVAVNTYGTTVTNFDSANGGTYGIAVDSTSDNNFGLLDTRHTTTTITSDPSNGLNTKTVATNTYGSTVTTFDSTAGGTYGIAVGSVADNNYGLLSSRHVVTVITADPSTGLNLKTVATTKYTVTTTDFDAANGGTYGIAVDSVADNSTGLGYTRHTTTVITSDPNSGLNLKTVATNIYGTTTTEFDTAGGGTYGIAVDSTADNNFGLLDTRHTTTVITSDPSTGLNVKTVATNLYGMTTTTFDSTTGGTVGIAVHSSASNYFGLEDTRNTETEITSDPDTGLNLKTVATNTYGRTTTDFDTEHGGKRGIAEKSYAENNFGLLDTRETNTAITSDPNTGLNLKTVATNLYGITTTDFDTENGGTYGIAVDSVSDNYFGLLDTRHTSTIITSDPNTGLNLTTVAHNNYGDTTTQFDTANGGSHGVPVTSTSANKFGLADTRQTVTQITSDPNTGLNTKTVANNPYGVTVTDFDAANGGTFGIAVDSTSDNYFGLLDARHTVTQITADPATGLNTQTTATNAYGVTVTDFDAANGGTYGISVDSTSDNFFGLLDARHTVSQITADPFTGLNVKTVATNTYGTTTTDFDTKNGGTYGIAVDSVSDNNFGLVDSRHTTTVITTDKNTGLNQETVATNTYGVTVTTFDSTNGGTLGVAVESVSDTNFGAGASRHTVTEITTDPSTGLNIETVATNNYGVTTTEYDSTDGGTYGIAIYSVSDNNYGLGYARHNVTDITTDPVTGMNEETVSTTDFGTTTTDFDTNNGGTYGVAVHSSSNNNFGIGATLDTNTTIITNTTTGMSTETVAVNDYGTTTTYFKGDSYGMQDYSVADNNYGAINERHTVTTFNQDNQTNLTKTSHAVSGPAGKPLRTVDTTYDANSGGTYGIAVSNVTTSTTGPTGGQVTNTVNDQVNTDTGMTEHSVVSNSLMTTENYLFEPNTGICLRSKTTNTHGQLASRTVQTGYMPNLYTGMNKSSYALTGVSGHYYSETWTDYKDTSDGASKDSYTKMNAGICYSGAQYTYTDLYIVNGDGVTTYSHAENLNSTTSTYNTSAGLSDYTDNYANYGVTYQTRTYSGRTSASQGVNDAQLLATGIASKSVSYSYSRDTSHAAYMSYSVSMNDSDGLAYQIDSYNMYGATLGQHSSTSSIQYDAWGFKTQSTTTSSLSTSTSYFDLKGTAYHTVSDSNLGPDNARHSDSYATETNDSNGIPEKSLSVNNMNWSNTFFDDMGRQSVVQKHNSFYQSVGLMTDFVDTTTYSEGFSWNGGPSSTREDSGGSGGQELVSQAVTTINDQGFSVQTETWNKYGLLGEEHTIATLTPDTTTGMTASSHTAHPSTGDYQDSQYAAGDYRNHGCVSHTDSYNADDKTTSHTDYSANFATGMSNYSHTWRDNTDSMHSYNSYGTVFNAVGQCTHDSASWSQQTGKDSWANKSTVTDHEYWTDNGCGSKDTETDQDGKVTVKWYDHDGYEAGESVHDTVVPNAYSQSFTEFNYGSQATGNWDPADPVGSTTYFGSTSSPYMVVKSSDFGKTADGNTSKSYNPKTQTITYPKGVFITSETIKYALNANNLPESATESDNQGTETWTLDGTYGFNAMTARTRKNNGGSTMSWKYTGDADGGRTATTTFSGFMGISNGTGVEKYSSTGILLTQKLTSSNAFNETLTYTNDGSFITGASGVREDGVTVAYQFVTMGDINQSSDDKGLTTWDPATHLRSKTKGGFGTFTYTYSGDFLQSIQGETAAKDGTMKYDQYWNMQSWTDKLGVTHNYTSTSKYKNYSTAATETFTDKNGAAWTGKVTYDTYGFYFKSETLNAKQAKVDAKGASNLVPIDQGQEITFLKTDLVSKYTQNDTFTYHSSTDTRSRTSLGQLKAAGLAVGNLNNVADVQITVNEDGSATAKFSNIKFTDQHFVQTSRYKPNLAAVYHTTDSLSTPPSSTFNYSNYDNPFFSGDCGYQITNVQTWQVAVYTTVPATAAIPAVPASAGPPPVAARAAVPAVPAHQVLSGYVTHYSWDQDNWNKASDGWMWTASGTDNENATETMTQDNNKVTASPVGTRADGLGQAATYKVGAGTSVGVSLGNDQVTQAAVTAGTAAFTQFQQGTYNTDFTGDSGTEAFFGTAGSLPTTPTLPTTASTVATVVVPTAPTTNRTAAAVVVLTPSTIIELTPPTTNVPIKTPTAVAVATKTVIKPTIASTIKGNLISAASALTSAVSLSAGKPQPVKTLPSVIVPTVVKPAPLPLGTVKGASAVTTTGAKPVATPVAVAAADAKAKVDLQTKLASQFKGLGVANAEAFAATALSKLTPQEIASALAGSSEGTEALMGALANAYQTLLGGTYQKSLLGSILDLAGTGSTFEAVKQALLGNASTAANTKVEAQKSQDARYAQVSRDENGNIVEAVGRNGEVYKFSYDASGKTETSLVGGTLTVKHFGNNNLLLSENSGGTSKTFAYTVGAQGQVTSTEVKVHSADGTQTLKYDAAGKLQTKEQNSVTQSYSYQGSKITVSARNAQGVEIVKKVYEGGRLVEKIDPSTHTQYSYMTDASGNVLGVTMKVTDKDGQTSFYKFNASGEMTGKAANGSNRFVKTEDNAVQESMAFESAKELFSDKRMVGEKLDQVQLQIQPVQVPRQRH